MSDYKVINKAFIDREKCIGCGTCVALCHKSVPQFEKGG